MKRRENQNEEDSCGMWWKEKRERGKWNNNETRCSFTYLEGSSAGFFTVPLLLTGRRFETLDACFVE